MELFTPGAIIHGAKKQRFVFRPVCCFFPRHSTMKWAVQSDLSLDHVRGAAAVAQKGKSGGAVSKTSVNKHRRRIFWAIPREKRVDAALVIFSIWEQIYSHMFLI